MKRRILSLTLTLALTLTLVPIYTAPTSAQTGLSGSAAKYAEHLDVIIDNNRIGTVHPLEPASNTPPAYWVMTMIYDRLISYNEDAKSFEPALATRWETSDYKTFTFDLRDDVVFHNGERFTAYDAVYTIKKAKEAEGSMMHSQWSPVKTAMAVDDYTLELVLSAVNVDFYMNLAHPASGIFNRRAVESDPENGVYIGTGAYIYTDFVSNDHVTLERNDNYWGTMPVTESMTLRYIPETATRAMLMLNGEADISFGMDARDYEPLMDNGCSVFAVTMNNVQGITFNMQNPITSDYNFRMAVAHAMDREAMTIISAGEWGMPINDGTGGDSVWGYATEFRNNDLPAIPYNVEKAKEYLAKSGYNGEEIVLATATSMNVIAAEVMQAMLHEIGIQVVIMVMDAASLYSLNNDPSCHMIFHSISFTYSADSSRSVFAPGGSQNRGSYNNPKVTELLTKAASTTSASARGEMYRTVQALVAEDKAFINVFWRINGVVAAKGVDGLTLTADYNHYDLRYAYMEIETSSPTPAPSSKTVNPTTSTVLVNDIANSFEAYNIDGNNYFKLRDLATVLDRTNKQFEVVWDAANNAISLISGEAYTSVGGEMAQGDGRTKTATPTTSRVYLDGKLLRLEAYNIGGNNFFKLRDVMRALDVGVTWDVATRTIGIDTALPYTD